MLWPILLPLQVTALLLLATIASATALAPVAGWGRGRMFRASLALGGVAFVPSCMGIMAMIDAQRFGAFSYENASDVGDFRVARYLPSRARDVTVVKRPNGHYARYTISKADLRAHLDALWAESGGRSAFPRDRLRDGEPVSGESIDPASAGLKWPPLANPRRFRSPVQADGGGAVYYLDEDAGQVYHRADYW